METIHKCEVCRCYVDDEDLFCANCGTENPQADATSAQPLQQYTDHYSFDCQSCGASMSYDASTQALRCPFCGSQAMKQQRDRRSIHSNWVAPLRVGRQQAEGIFRGWLGRGFWRPHDAVSGSQIGQFSAVYLPFWVFEAEADTRWTADSSPAPPGSRGQWYPVSGSNRSTHRDILIAASSIVTFDEADRIGPFDLGQVVPSREVDLVNALVETFRVPRKQARPLARAVVEQREQQICSQYVPGRPRNVKVNVHIQGMAGRPVLLPVWILVYRHRDVVHRVLINGQSGKIAGTAPFSAAKLSLVVAIAVGILAGLALLVLLLGLISRL